MAKFREYPQTDDWVNTRDLFLKPKIVDYIEAEAWVLELDPAHMPADLGQPCGLRLCEFW